MNVTSLIHLHRLPKFNRYSLPGDDYKIMFSYPLKHSGLTREQICEFVFDATNNPQYDEELNNRMPDCELSDKAKLLKEWRKVRLCSLSVSDRIEVESLTYECMPSGWKEI